MDISINPKKCKDLQFSDLNIGQMFQVSDGGSVFVKMGSYTTYFFNGGKLVLYESTTNSKWTIRRILNMKTVVFE